MATITPRTIQAGQATITIRSGLPDDAEALLQGRREEAGASPHLVTQLDEITESVEEQAEWIRKRTDDPNEIFIVAEATRATDTRLIGSLALDVHNRRRLHHRAEFGVTVLKDWRGLGIGTALIQTALDYCRESPNIEILALGVFHTNTKAIALYERLGFTREGADIDYFKVGPNDYADNVIMTKRVKPRS